MQNFLIKFSIFIIPLLVIYSILELLSRKLPNELYKEEKEYIENHSQNVEVFILGTSANACGLNPQYFDLDAINMANGSQSLEYDYFLLNKYIKTLPNLKYVVIEIGFSSFYRDMLDRYAFRAYYYYRYFDCKKNINRFTIKKVSDFSINPSRSITRIVDYYLKKTDTEQKMVSFKGWTLMKGNFDNQSQEQVMLEAKDFFKYQWDNFFNEKTFEKNLTYINKIFNLCVDQNIQMVVITPPVYKSYSDNIIEEKYLLMQELIAQYKEKYNFSYYNLFYDSRFTFEDFYNHNHVNGKGAKKIFPNSE